MSGEKTEEPTEKKLKDAREKGESPKSPDVNAALGLFALTVCLVVASKASAEHLFKMFAIFYERGILAQTNDDVFALIFDMVKEGGMVVLPYLGIAVVVGLFGSFAQVGVQITFKPITPDFNKINPASGIKKIFSIRSLVDFLKMVFKALVLGAVAFFICMGLLPLLVGASLYSPEGVIAVGWSALLKLLGAAIIVFIVIGPFDFALQKWLFIRDQRMSKDEVKREHKEMEGDPQLKGQRKQIAHEMANEAPRAAVPGASVVVANPTHYAVALRYVPGQTPLPVVVAKGIDAQALEIRAIAEEHRVPVVVNPPLARQLHRVPLNESIPEALFEAVAAVLRWVRLMEQLTRHVSGTAAESVRGAAQPDGGSRS